MREFLGIDKALTRIKGELENNAGKLSEIDEHLEREERKLAEIETSPDLQIHEERVKAKIADLQEERSARLEIISQNRKELASQFSRIRQTVEKILDSDLNLREKLKLILREHGLTITAVLTSLGLIISTIVSSLTGGAAGSSQRLRKTPTSSVSGSRTSSKPSLDFSVDLRVRQPLHCQGSLGRLSLVF